MPLSGSSPRMWGTHRAKSRSLCNTTVHPHACGERPCIQDQRPSVSGSSPRMWGTRENFPDEFPVKRFIPTHVGNAPNIAPDPSPKPVHPHACGERHPTAEAMQRIRGSSPRMWGTPSSVDKYHALFRFIPTHVGNA